MYSLLDFSAALSIYITINAIFGLILITIVHLSKEKVDDFEFLKENKAMLFAFFTLFALPSFFLTNKEFK